MSLFAETYGGGVVDSFTDNQGVNNPLGAERDPRLIFHIDKVQFQPPAPILDSVVCRHILVLALANGHIIIIDLLKSSSMEDIEIIQQKDLTNANAKISMKKLFLDPTGRHLIICLSNYEYSYIFLPGASKKPKPLSKFKGLQVTCIGWGPSPYGAEMETFHISSNCTLECLVSTANGLVYEVVLEPTDEYFKKEEKYFKLVYTIPESFNNKVITDVHYEYLIPRGSNPVSGPRLYYIILATQEKLCQFVAKQPVMYPPSTSPLFEPIFLNSYLTEQELFSVLPKDQSAEEVNHGARANSPSDSQSELFETSSKLTLYRPFAVHDPDTVVYAYDFNGRRLYPFLNSRSFSWLTINGIYYGQLMTDYHHLMGKDDHSIIEDANLIPQVKYNWFISFSFNIFVRYSSKVAVSPGSHPRLMAMSEFHFILLYPDSVRCLNILNAEVEFEEPITDTASKAYGLMSDPVEQTFWIFSRDSLFEIIVTEEDKNIWQIYLDRRQFDNALSYCKNSIQRNKVMIQQADWYFKSGKYLLAATYYAQTSVSIEKVCLLFYEKRELEAVKTFLSLKLESYPKKRSMQLILLCNLLLQVYLSWLTHLQENGLKAEEKSAQDELYVLFRNNQFLQNLHMPTVFQLVLSYGRVEEYLNFCIMVGEIDRALDYHCIRGNHLEALKILDTHGSSDHYYKYASEIIVHCPKEMIDALIKKSSLNAKHLLAALLKYSTKYYRERHMLIGGTDGEDEHQAIRYLEFCIKQQRYTDPVIHNYLLYLYVQLADKSEDKLVSYIRSQENVRYFDIHYALRLCIQYNRTNSCILLFGCMHNYAEAVELSLKINDLTLASVYADKPLEEDPALCKRLWLRIAKHLLDQKKPMKEVINLLYSTSVLKFEDLFPLFPESVQLDDFKDELISSLESSQLDIENLKREMDEATQSAEQIKQDLLKLSQRHHFIQRNATCEICSELLMTGPFYVFPCNHYFHLNCMIGDIAKWYSPRTIQRIQELEKRIRVALKMNNNVQVDNNNADESHRNVILFRNEIDQLLGSECFLCGDKMIESIDKPFVDAESELDLIQSWKL